MRRPTSGYPPESAVGPDSDPSYAATSPAHRKARPSIFPIKRDTTRIIGHGMSLHPFVVIVATLCGAALAGVPGIFLAIPTVAILSVGYRHWLEHSGSEGLVADLLKRRE